MNPELQRSTMEYITEALAAYRDRHIWPGEFLVAVLTNNPDVATIGTKEEVRCLDKILLLAKSVLPAESWGTPEIVRKWLGWPVGEYMDAREKALEINTKEIDALERIVQQKKQYRDRLIKHAVSLNEIEENMLPWQRGSK